VYDMYPWSKRPGRGATRGAPDQPGPRRPATQAVQVALDRRDNGGEAAAADTSSETIADPARQ